MAGTFVFLIFLVGGVPVLDGLGWVRGVLSWLSPFYPFFCAVEPTYPLQPGKYWRSLLASHFLGWFFIALASFILPRLWQEGSKFSGAWSFLNRSLRSRGGNAVMRAKRRAEPLLINPVLWLVGDEPALRRLAWAVVAAWGIYVLTSGQLPAASAMWHLSSTSVCGLLLKILFAFQACRFFVEARRTGALELLLCTPLSNSEILKGQWLALRRIFLWPLLSFLLLNFVPVVFAVHLALTGPGQGQIWTAILQTTKGLTMLGWLGISLLADTFAVGWVGMRLALTAKRPHMAPALTILYVLILPSIVCVLSLMIDLFFILWAATGLHQDLRWMLARQYQRPARASAAPPLSSSPALPPVLAR
jgi:hypothetical protein